MLGKFESSNRLDKDGNPSGGKVQGIGLEITWQDGPLGRDENRVEPNGAFVETVIAAMVDRLQFFQSGANGKFACRENALAITKLEEALHWLDHRTRARDARGAEGTYKV